MSSRQVHRTGLCLFGASMLMFSVQARADVGPPVEIKMSLEAEVEANERRIDEAVLALYGVQGLPK